MFISSNIKNTIITSWQNKHCYFGLCDTNSPPPPPEMLFPYSVKMRNEIETYLERAKMLLEMKSNENPPACRERLYFSAVHLSELEGL